MNMTWDGFLDEIIKGGIEGAEKSYSNPRNKNHPLMLEGAKAGFERCCGKNSVELAELLAGARANTQRAFVEELPDYWRHRCFEAEIEWVCNCVSVVLTSGGQPGIVVPTGMAAMRVNDILMGKDRAVICSRGDEG